MIRALKTLFGVAFCLVPAASLSTTYYLTPYDNRYPTGVCNGQGQVPGSGGACSWNGFEDLQQQGLVNLKGGDEVFIIGTHVKEITSGQNTYIVNWAFQGNGSYITFRGDYPGLPGVIAGVYRDSRPDGVSGLSRPWDSCNDGCPDGLGGTLSRQGVYYNYAINRNREYWTRGIYEYWNGPGDYSELTQVGALADVVGPGTIFVSDDGMQVWIYPNNPINLENNNMRWSGQHSYSSRFGNGANYIKWKGITFFAPGWMYEAGTQNAVGNLTYEGCTFIREKTWRPEGSFRNVKMSGCEYDGRRKSANFFYPWAGNSVVSDITIENCYIHDTFCEDATDICDGHAIGFQGSSVSNDNLTFTHNTFANVGDAITLWHGVSDGFSNVLIAYNNITADYNLEENPSSRGSAITLSRSSASVAGLNSNVSIVYNVIRPPENCPANPGVCNGVRSTWIDPVGVYGNVVDGANVSFKFNPPNGNPSVDLKNNISIQPKYYHVVYDPVSDGTSVQWGEDNNQYFPIDVSSGKSFWYDFQAVAYSDYNNSHGLRGRSVNKKSLIGAPALDENYRPTSQSTVRGSGASLDAKYRYALSVADTWPSAREKGVFRTTDQSERGLGWDIGAKVTDTAPSPPSNVQLKP